MIKKILLTAAAILLAHHVQAQTAVEVNKPLTIEFDWGPGTTLNVPGLTIATTPYLDGKPLGVVSTVTSSTGGRFTIPASHFATAGAKPVLTIGIKWQITDPAQRRCAATPGEIATAAPWPVDCGEVTSAPFPLVVGQPVTPKPPAVDIKTIRIAFVMLKENGAVAGQMIAEMKVDSDGVWRLTNIMPNMTGPVK